MPSFIRRAGTELIGWIVSAASPAADPAGPQIYAKTVAGVAQLAMQNGDGIEFQLTPSVGIARAIAYYINDFVLTIGQSAVAGGGAVVATTLVTNHPGISQQSVTNVATGDGAIIFSSLTGTITTWVLGTGQLVFEGNVLSTSAQDGTHQYTDRFGMGDTASATADQANGVYLEADRATYGDNNYRLCAASGGVRTKTTTGTAPAVNTFERWRFVVTAAADSVSAFLNDTAIGSAVATNIPTVALLPYFRQVTKTLGNQARTFRSDYFEIYQVLSR